MFLSSHAILKSISIHAPAKGATYNLTNAGIVRLFQSTLPRRERQNGLQKIRKHMHFNPRSREGSDVVFIHWSFIVAYFNPRSREGSDEQSFPNLTELLTISIHAPAKGATGLFSLWKVDKIISIHAPAKGATINVAWSQLIDKFQSTLPRRERRGADRESDKTLAISIHAPAKGATHVVTRQISSHCISIHAPAKGATSLLQNMQCLP